MFNLFPADKMNHKSVDFIHVLAAVPSLAIVGVTGVSCGINMKAFRPQDAPDFTGK